MGLLLEYGLLWMCLTLVSAACSLKSGSKSKLSVALLNTIDTAGSSIAGCKTIDGADSSFDNSPFRISEAYYIYNIKRFKYQY